MEEYGEVELVNYIDLDINDQEFALKMRNDISVKRWMYSQRDISAKEHRDFINTLNNKKERHYFLVKLKSTIVGSINFSNIVPKYSVDFGLFTNPYIEWKGAGRILEAVGNYYADFRFGIKKLKLEVFSDNTRAIKFYKKCGYRFVGSDTFQEKKIFFMEKSRDAGEHYEKYN